MNDVRQVLERQAAWQASLRMLPWPLKIQMAEKARPSLLKLRQAPADPLNPRGEGR